MDKNAQDNQAIRDAIKAKTSAQLAADSDEWFINNVIGLASAELALAQKQGRRVNRHRVARWVFDNAQKV